MKKIRENHSLKGIKEFFRNLFGTFLEQFQENGINSLQDNAYVRGWFRNSFIGDGYQYPICINIFFSFSRLILIAMAHAPCGNNLTVRAPSMGAEGASNFPCIQKPILNTNTRMDTKWHNVLAVWPQYGNIIRVQ